MASLAEAAVRTAQSDYSVKGSAAAAIVEDCLKELTPALDAAQRNPEASVPQIESSMKELEKAISKVQEQISQEIGSIK